MQEQPDPRTFRRLRLSDLLALQELCEEDKRWNPHFHQHKKWLQRTLKALELPGSDGRVVFGGFLDQMDESRGSYQRLDSAIFLKVSELDNSAELKNLVLRDEPNGKGLSDRARSASKHLIEKAIRFCEMRDIAKLEIELPQVEHVIISIFLEKGFRVLSQRERYFPGQSVYVLEKQIGETYFGDPFNHAQLGVWLLHSILPCKVGAWSNFEDKHAVLSYFPFEISPAHPAFSGANPTGYGRRLRGGLFILDEPRCIPEYFERLERLDTPKENHVNYLMADRLPKCNRERLSEHGFVCFDRDEVRAIAGGEDSSLDIPIQDRADVAGVLTVLEEQLVKEYAKLGNQFIYYLLGGIGGTIVVCPPESGDSSGSILAVHCPRWEGGPPAIVAVAQIINKAASDIWEAHNIYPKEIPRALSKEDLEFYAIRNKSSDEDGQREEVVSLFCSKLEILRKPLRFNDPVWASLGGMRRYILKELEHSNTAYLNTELCNELRERTSDEQPSQIGLEQAPARVDSTTVDIVVIVIREDEQEAVLKRLPGAKPHVARGAYMVGDVPIGNSGECFRVAVTRAQEQGPSEAQFTTQNAIEDLHPQWLALVGIAGAVPDSEFTLGDVIIASRVHDFSISAAVENIKGEHKIELANQGGPMRRVIGHLINLLPSILKQVPDWNSEKNIANPRPEIDYSEENLYGSEEWKSRTRSSLARINRKFPIVTARAGASSGTLVKDTEVIRGFLSHSRDVAHVEMELAGVYHAASTARDVYPILSIRGISDIVGLKRDPDWTGYACNSAAAFFFSLLQVMPEGLLQSRKGDAYQQRPH